MAARGIGVQVAPDEPEIVDAPLEFRNTVGERVARRLWQLADADKILRVKRADALNQIVAVLGPVRLVAASPM